MNETDLYHIPTGRIAPFPEHYTFVDGRSKHLPSLEDLVPEGYRLILTKEAPAEGFIVTKWNCMDTGMYCHLTISEVEEAQKEKAVVTFPLPVQGTFEVIAPDGHVYGIEVDPVSGVVFAVQRESVRLTDSEYATLRDSKLRKRKDSFNIAKVGISGQLQSRIENIERLLGLRE